MRKSAMGMIALLCIANQSGLAETIIVAQDDVVKYCNQKVEELTGYSMQEISEVDFGKFVHPDDLKIVLSEYQARISGEKRSNKYTLRIITKQGQTKYIFINSALISWDGRTATLAMLTDITEQELAREDLKQSEAYFRSLMEHSPLAMVIYNTKGKILQYNIAWKKLWGFNDEEVNQIISEYNILSDKQAEERGVLPLIKKGFKQNIKRAPPRFRSVTNLCLSDT